MAPVAGQWRHSHLASGVVVTGVILDSGGVLRRAITGEWFPPPAFHVVMHFRGLTWDQRRLDDAVAFSGRYLDEIHATPLAEEAQRDRPG